MKKLEDEFAKLPLDEMGPALERLNEVYRINVDARRKALMSELDKLGGPMAASPRVGNGKRAKKDGDQINNGKKPSDKRANPKAKYKDPKTGQTWAGRGGTPKWVLAYEAAGKSRDEFLV